MLYPKNLFLQEIGFVYIQNEKIKNLIFLLKDLHFILEFFRTVGLNYIAQCIMP